MKKYGAILALALAVLSGLFAVTLAKRWLAGQAQQPVAAVGETLPLTRIVIAAKDLAVGEPLCEAALTLAEWPKASTPQGSLEKTEGLAGRVVATRLKAGQPILAGDLAAPGSGAGLVSTIQPGKRAMAIRVDEVIGVGGFVLPNTQVDVIAVWKDCQDREIAEIILEQIDVLAIAQETYTEDGKPKIVKTVTLQLDPAEAEKLALHLTKGPVHLALRNALEADPPRPAVAAAPAPRLAAAPVPAPRPRLKAPEAKPPFAVEVIRRSKAETLRFKDSDSAERI